MADYLGVGGNPAITGMFGNSGGGSSGGSSAASSAASGMGSGGFDFNKMMGVGLGMGGLSSLFSGLFGNSGAPYESAMEQYDKYLKQAKDVQNPFYNAGKGAIPDYQNWLKGMQNPSGFINNLMGQYQESPFAKYQQQQGLRTAQNLGSATGLTGSTPLQLQAQQNSQNISSADMQDWLGRVLGINTEYGAGQKSLVNTGQGSANALTDLLSNYGKSMGELAYGKEAGRQQDQSNIFGGLAGLAGSLAFL